MDDNKIRVVVYGTLKKGGALHNNMKFVNAEFVEATKLKGWRMHNMGWYPAIVHDPENEVSVEVYEIDKDKLNVLDKVEGYPALYKRMETDLGFVYYMDEDLDRQTYPVIEDGIWKINKD